MNATETLSTAALKPLSTPLNEVHLASHEYMKLTQPEHLTPQQLAEALEITYAAGKTRTMVKDESPYNTAIPPKDMRGCILYATTKNFSLPLLLIGPKNQITEVMARTITPDYGLGHSKSDQIIIPVSDTNYYVVYLREYCNVKDIGIKKPGSGSTGFTKSLSIFAERIEDSSRWSEKATFSIVYIDCYSQRKMGMMSGLNVYIENAPTG